MKRIRNKKMVSLLLIIMMLTSLVLAGCNDKKTQESSKKDMPKIAFFAYDSEPVLDWDPSIATSNEILILHNMYETLLRYDAENGEVTPVIAEKYSVSDDGLEWTFNIRKGMKFHDGTDVNAEAVKFSIERTIEMNMGAAYIWDPVEEIQVADEHTVKILLSYPAPLDYIASASYAAFIMSPTAVKNNVEDWFSLGNEAGSGPYMLQSSKMGEEVVLKKFDDYWRSWNDKQYDKILVRKITETSSRRQLLEKSEATITFELPSEDIEVLMKNENLQVINADTFTNLVLHLNTEIKPLNNKLVRQALSYAFPYEDVVKYAAGGYGEQSRGVIPKGILGYSDDIFQYSYDLDKAKELLAEAGYGDGGFSILFTYTSGDEVQKKMGELYKTELKKLNIELEIRGMQWDSYLELSKANNPEDRQGIMAMYWWPEYALPYSWLYNMYHSSDYIAWNQSYWSNEKFDKLIDDAVELVAVDSSRAEEMFIEAQNMLTDEAPTIYVLDRMAPYVAQKSIKGIKINPAYERVIFFYDTYEE